MQIPTLPRRWALPATFSSLRHRNFRLLWFGSVVSSSGDWMDQIAFNWLVYQLTGSAIYLGITNLCRMGPILLFTLIGGVAADRMERRRLMFTTQAVAMLLALVLAVLVSTNLVQVWMVLAIAVGRGVMMSFNQPARQSLISELVPREHLQNAVALNSATFNLTRIIGPAIGGLLIATVGVAGAFFVNAASFAAVLYGLALMRFPERPMRAKQSSVLADLAGGMRYLRAQPDLRALVVLALLPLVFGTPYMTMLTVFARDVLNVGGSGLGILSACAGAGALVGALIVASRSEGGRRGRVMLLSLVGYGLALSLFSFSHWFWLSLVALLAVGGAQQTYNSLNNTLLQEHVDDEYRGRVLSTLFLNRGMVPLGMIIAGLGTELVGPQIAMGAMGAILVVMALLAARYAPTVRHLS